MARFKLFGINFLVGVDFLCLITFMLYVDKTGYMTPCLLAVFVHEMGHILALKCLRTPPDRVELKIGTIEVKGRFVLSNKNSAVMLLFGPLTNFIMALLFLLLYSILKGERFVVFGIIMALVGLFNLLPVTGTDGGELTAIFLSLFLKTKTQRVVRTVISALFCFLLFCCGGFIFIKSKRNPSMLLLAIYLVVCTFKNNK